MSAIQKTDESINEMSQEMMEQFEHTQTLIKYNEPLQNIKLAMQHLKFLPVKEHGFKVIDTNNTKKIEAFTNFVLYDNGLGVVNTDFH